MRHVAEALVVIVAIMPSFGCSPEPEYIEATIDGALWQAEHVSCFYNSTDQSLDITGSSELAGDTARFLRLIDVPTTGSGPVPLAESDGPHATIADGVVFVSARTVFSTTAEFTGSAVVAELDENGRRTSGTFEFAAVTVFGQPFDTLQVTRGAWACPLFE